MHRLRFIAAFTALAIASASPGASAHDHDRDDRYAGAGQSERDGQLSPGTQRALRRFDEQKHRDYRRLGKQRFDSDRERERAYRKLRQAHRDRLREILGEARFEDDRFRRYRDEHEYRQDEDEGDLGKRDAVRVFDPVKASAAIASQWALDESDREDLTDLLDDYAEDIQEFRAERFDSAEERRQAQRELEQDYRDELLDILDDATDTDVSDILERVQR